MATSALTGADLDEMSLQDLRQMMISQGQKPKKMKRERMIHWLKDNLSFPETAEAIFSHEPKTDSPGVEAIGSIETQQTLPVSVAA